MLLNWQLQSSGALDQTRKASHVTVQQLLYSYLMVLCSCLELHFMVMLELSQHARVLLRESFELQTLRELGLGGGLCSSCQLRFQRSYLTLRQLQLPLELCVGFAVLSLLCVYHSLLQR